MRILGNDKITVEYEAPTPPYKRSVDVKFVENSETGRIDIQIMLKKGHDIEHDIGFIGFVQER
jgi:hypothetical protein